MSASPALQAETTADGVLLRLSGDWTLSAGSALERTAAAISAARGTGRRARVDISAVGALDTAGAWVIDRARHELSARGLETELSGVRSEHATLLREARYREIESPPRRRPFLALALVSDVGETVALAVGDLWGGLDFLGRVVARSARTLVLPRHWRVTAFVHHLENFSLRGAPIIIMINMFVGAIVAQQGILQLQRFGAVSLTSELVSILTLRELGVLLTSIMVAGRSGSSITAEIGAMRMREEVDAMTVMAVDPFETLVLPRLAALVFALPILTMLGDVAALFGGMCAMWGIGNVSPVAYLASLQAPYFLQRFFVGLIKAPFMALVIGLIGAAEGFAVQGSAESLGQKVTSSVVKSIFTVIVLDGMFALFFAAVDY
jgi:phospholipid/cholesterol/gamma-HCH transport system permease protein